MEAEMKIGLPWHAVCELYTAAEVGQQDPWWYSDFNLAPDPFSDAVIGGNVDTGVDEIHVKSGDLAGVVLNARDFSGSGNYYDHFGHGTHVSGIMAAVDNGFGIRGGCRAKLNIAKGLGDNGSGSDEWVANAILWHIDVGTEVLNCSLGSRNPSKAIERAVKRADAAGMLIVAAAGNDGANTVSNPADLEEVFAVAAINQALESAYFSNKGRQVQVACPGVRVMSCYRKGGYAELDGTSMAAPWFAALLCRAVGRYKAKGKKLTRGIVTEVLKTTCKDLGVTGRDVSFGFGVPDPPRFLSAIDALLAVPVTPPPETPVTPPVPAPAPGRLLDITVRDSAAGMVYTGTLVGKKMPN